MKLLERSDPAATAGALFSIIHCTQDGSDDVWTFAENILDSRNKLLYVRDCYPKIYDEMWRFAVRNKGVKETDYYPVIVSETSGFSKSFFGIYALLRAVREKNIPVIYNYNNKEWYVIAPLEKKMQLFDKGDPGRWLLDLRSKFPDCLIGHELMESEKEKDDQSLWWGQVHTDMRDADNFIQLHAFGTSTWVLLIC